MTATVYREGCGTLMALRLHQANSERPCSECLRGEELRLLELETIPHRLPEPGKFAPVTPAEAQLNAKVLDHEVQEHERSLRQKRHLRVVDAA